jgi:hypothetical protein
MRAEGVMKQREHAALDAALGLGGSDLTKRKRFNNSSIAARRQGYLKGYLTSASGKGT